MSVVTVVGNPRPKSRTFHAATRVARALTDREPDSTIDLAELGAELLDWKSTVVAEAKQVVVSADLVVVASPTYKGTYTGLLKLFLDRFAADELFGVTAVPVMVGGDARRSLAPEVSLKPVLAEIGATCPTRGLFLVDTTIDEPDVLAGWLEAARRQVAATHGRLR